MNRQEMIEELIQRDCRVIFKKVNGEERTMKCTLHADVVPATKKDDPISQKAVRAISEETIVAWDVDKDAWRSFRVENVVSFS
jgi:hypothetical protein